MFGLKRIGSVRRLPSNPSPATNQASPPGDLYRIDIGGVVGLLLLLFLSLLFALAMAHAPTNRTSPAQITTQLQPSAAPATNTPLTLGDLIKIMKDKLQEQGVAAEALPHQNLLRVMIRGPMFPFSQAELHHKLRPGADAVGAVLAWALRCHLSTPSSFPWPDTPKVASQCSSGSSLVSSRRLARGDCLANRGRIELSGLIFKGHTDTVPFRPKARGPFKSNQQLSSARAERFSQHVIGCAQRLSQVPEKRDRVTALPGVRFTHRGFGSSQAMIQNGRDPRNRRVEILFQETASSFDIKAMHGGFTAEKDTEAVQHPMHTRTSKTSDSHANKR